jgi:hypothetical protein
VRRRGVDWLGQQPVELTAAPARNQLDPDVDCLGNSPDRLEGDFVEPASLDPGDRRRRESGTLRHVRLAEPATDPDCPERSAGPEIIHRRAIMTSPPSPALI